MATISLVFPSSHTCHAQISPATLALGLFLQHFSSTLASVPLGSAVMLMLLVSCAVVTAFARCRPVLHFLSVRPRGAGELRENMQSAVALLRSTEQSSHELSGFGIIKVQNRVAKAIFSMIQLRQQRAAY